MKIRELVEEVLKIYDKPDAPLFEGIGEYNGNVVAVALARALDMCLSDEQDEKKAFWR
jgi:hypothetical protein